MTDKEIIKVETDALLLIESVVKNAYEKAIDGDLTCLDDIFIFKRLGCFWLYQTLSDAIIQMAIRMSKTTEMDVHEWFRQNFKNILGESYEISEKRSNCKHQPDLWLSHEDEYIPVECKLHEFTEAGLRQLTRYMTFYGANSGIAVASELKCELPQNIRFIKHEAQHG